ncbi:MAG: serine/threonine protein kinase, partial [Planctomycetales bacterium]
MGALTPLAEAVAELGLISLEEIQACASKLPVEFRPGEPSELAWMLTNAGVLTHYQSAIISRGNPQRLRFGQMIARENLAQGHRSELFQARDGQSNGSFAVKWFCEHLAPWDQELERFNRDLENLRRFSHPDFLNIAASGVKEGRPFWATPYLEHIDLAKEIRRNGVVDVGRAVDIIWRVADVLAAASQHKMLHLNVKPSQILLAGDGVILTDLGIAHFNRRAIHLDAQGSDMSSSGTRSQLLRTEDFAAPEFVLHPQRADLRSDVYSLGGVLYFMLTGMPLYSRPSPQETLNAHQYEPVPRLAELCNEAPPALQAIFEKMVAKQPSDRYQSHESLQNALRPLGHLSPSKPAKKVQESQESQDDPDSPQQSPSSTDSPSKIGKGKKKKSKRSKKSKRGEEQKPKKKNRKDELLPLL